MRLTPAGGADRIDGVSRDDKGLPVLNARVRAAPENGEANRALEALLAKALGVAKSKVSVVRGGASRLKSVAVEGVSAPEIAAFLAKIEERS